MHFNYNQVIRPRGDLLNEKLAHFDLEEAFKPDDEEFCKNWGIDPEELDEAKSKRRAKGDEEVDILWKYVHL